MVRSYRFTINTEDELLEGDQQILVHNQDLLHQINNVLRLKPGAPENISFIDGIHNKVFLVSLLDNDSNSAHFQIIDKQDSSRELTQEVNFFVPVIKSDAFALMIRKLTELGVQNFIPVNFEYSQKPNLQSIQNQETRLNNIIREATEQCEGAVLAKLNPVINFADIDKHMLSNSISIFASERLANNPSQESTINLDKIKSSSKINLVVGPEAGLSDQEASQLEAIGFMPYRLGSRLLKAETAAIALFASLHIK